jgi:DNA invertase Pin-like site-specific DNA recombinase
MTIRAVIYARTSTDCVATAEEQVKDLQLVAETQGWRVDRTFADRPMPLKRGRERRPGETALLEIVRAGAVEKVLLLSADRVGRTLVELVGFLETCRTSNVDIYIHDRQIDTATSNGLTLFDLSAMFAHHLRQGRRDRILRGQAAARGADIRFGRPPIASSRTEKVRSLLARGKGVRETARLVGGISAASISRIKASIKQQVTSL